MTKGISLPVNALVVLVVAIVVLVSIIAIYFGTSQPTKGRTDAQATFREGCTKLLTNGGCTGSVADPAKIDAVGNLRAAASAVGINGADNEAIKRACCGG